jgi:hypothetical protein
MAYGTDKHESYFLERGEKAKEGKLVARTSSTCVRSSTTWRRAAGCRPSS